MDGMRRVLEARGAAFVGTAVAVGLASVAVVVTGMALTAVLRSTFVPSGTRWRTATTQAVRAIEHDQTYASRSLSSGSSEDAVLILATGPRVSLAGVEYTGAVAYWRDGASGYVVRASAAWDWSLGPPCSPADPWCDLWSAPVPVSPSDGFQVSDGPSPIAVQIVADGRATDVLVYPENP